MTTHILGKVLSQMEVRANKQATSQTHFYKLQGT